MNMLDNIPKEMKDLPNWVLWRYRSRDGKKTKIPYSVTGKPAKSNAPETWTSFDKAARLMSEYDGVGFMLGNSPFVGIDLDHCLDTAERKARAKQLVTDCNTYTEISPSGTGLHIIGKADLEKGFRDNDIEVYPSGRYFTVTGNSFGDALPVGNIQSIVDRLQKSIEGSRTAAPSQAAIPASPKALPLDVAEIVALIRKSKEGPDFSALFDRGDTSKYHYNDSSADQALMNMLAFWTNGNKELMRQIFSESALAQREKWQKRPEYQDWTINTALKSWNGKGYDPQQYKKEQAKKEIAEFMAKNQYPEGVDKQLAEFEMTDAGNAERMKLLFKGTLGFLAEAGRQPDKWIRWNGKTWARVYDEELFDAVTTMTRKTQQAVELYETDDDVKKYKKAFLTRSENQRGIDACLKNFRGKVTVHLKDFDSKPYLLNVQNGILNLKAGKLLPHDKKYKLSKITRAAYRPELIGRPSLWTQALESMMPDKQEREYLQMWAGYALVGEAVEEKLLFLYGEGGTGKSTFTETLAYMLGDYAGTVDIELFLSSRNDGGADKATPGLAGLKGVRLAIGAESGIGRKMNDAKLKNLTGRDAVTTRFLYGNPFSFTPCATFMLSSNYLPPVKDATDSGIRRRLVIAPFTHVPDKKDKFLKSKLRKQDNMDAVLAWCVEGFHKWEECKAGLDAVPERFKRQAARFYEDSDTLQQFLDEECVTGDPNARSCLRVKVKELLTAYRLFLEESIKRGVFMELMRRKGYVASLMDGNNVFKGLDLKENHGLE
jgi:putative DNA primase/helicase